MKRCVVIVLEAICGALDRLPAWGREDGHLHPYTGDWGCRLHIAELSIKLDERWNTGVWDIPKERT